jgi:hypothetical protein
MLARDDRVSGKMPIATCIIGVFLKERERSSFQNTAINGTYLLLHLHLKNLSGTLRKASMGNVLQDRSVGSFFSRTIAIPVTIIILSVVIVSGPA